MLRTALRCLGFSLAMFNMAQAAVKIEVQGHRGARALRPENTLAAFEYALEVGVDTLEMDLGVTRDDQLVVLHDPRINTEICLGPGATKLTEKAPIRSLTLAELQKLDCGTLKHPRFPKQQPVPGEKIPTLEGVLDMLSKSKLPGAKTVELNIEMKSFPGEPELTPAPPRFAKLVVELLKKKGFLDRAVLQSFDHRTLREARKLAPRVRISALNEASFPDYTVIAKELKANIISPNHEWIDADAVARLHRMGVKVVPWTLNEPEEWERAIRLKFDGIITDDPAALLEWLRARKLHP